MIRTKISCIKWFYDCVGDKKNNQKSFFFFNQNFNGKRFKINSYSNAHGVASFENGFFGGDGR